MSARHTVSALVCALTIPGSAVFAQERGSKLGKNPFNRPSYMVQLAQAPASIFTAEPVELQLLATLVSAERSLANLNGEILAVGDTHEGYQLLRIDEGRVLLIKDGQRTTLDLYESTDPDGRE